MIYKMEESGFCAGVRNAVNEAMQCKEQGQVVLYGNLVNNDHVMQSFLDKGYLVLEDTSLVPSNSVVVLRAHGVPRMVYEELENKNVVIKDGTCGKVKYIHHIVDEKSHDGYKIIIVGKKIHPEVVGTVGWCAAGSAVVVVGKEEDLGQVDLNGKVCVVAQTTCNKELWEKMVRLILNTNPSAEVYDTVCMVTSQRENKACEIAKDSDMMIVIGDEKSSNSQELFRQCLEKCKQTFFIQSLVDLEKNEEAIKVLLYSEKIGLVGSASTPDNIIQDVYNYLKYIDFYKTAKTEIENEFQRIIPEFELSALHNSFVQDSLKSLWKQNEGGKRIRGALIKLGEKIALNYSAMNYLPIAVGYELFQTSILIHDDIIDKSDLRRNKRTIHVESSQNIKDALGVNITDRAAEHFGIARALCIGDYGFFIAYQLLAQCEINKDDLLKIYQLYAKVVAFTCEGEIMDTILPFERISILENYDEYEETIRKIYEYKTAWYTLAGPIILGAVCGGASEDLVFLLKNIMIPLGIAFQIKDDLLGIYSNDDALGKSVLSDIRENKQTLLYGYAYKNANEEQRNLLDQHYGKVSADQNDLEIVRKLFEETGARRFANDEIARLSEYSRRLIDNQLIDEENQSILYGLISYLIERKF